MTKLRVGVLMGGKSIEAEVSFNSGRTVCDHLDVSLYDVVPIFQTFSGDLYILPWHFLHRGKISDFEHRLSGQAEKISWDILSEHIDFMYIAVHGRFAEDGTLQGALELFNIPYLGSGILASALSMDKIAQKKVLAYHDIKTPSSFIIYPHEADTLLSEFLSARMEKYALDFPCIVKPAQEGSSLGINEARDYNDLLTYIQKAMHIDPRLSQAVLVEEKIMGMEFSCITILDEQGNLRPLPPTEIVPDDGSIFSYEQKYMPGRAYKFTPPRCDTEITERIQDICKKTMQALNFKTLSRIDGFVQKDGEIVIVDPNAHSGLAPSSFFFREAAEIGMSHTLVINHLIETELKQRGITFHMKSKKDNTDTPKLKVVVLIGGDSNEREISLESGRNICYKLSSEKYKVIPLFVSQEMTLHYLTSSQLVRNSTKEITSLINKDDKVTWQSLPEIADFVFIGLHGGKGENGTVQGMLDMLGMPYNGSGVLASALCMDKYKTNQFLQAGGFNVPHSLFIKKSAWQQDSGGIRKQLQDQLQFPVVVKPHNDGSSVAVYYVADMDELEVVLANSFQDKKELLVEEYITGMELTVGIIGNDKPYALPPSYTVTSGKVLSMQEKFLPGAGENQTPAPLSEHALHIVQRTLEDVYRYVQCSGYARIDCFYQNANESPTGKERVIILEINTLPALTPATCLFHQAAEIGMRPADMIDRIIAFGLELRKMNITKNESAAITEKIS